MLDGFLFAATPDEVELLDDELAAAHRTGLTGVEKVARAPLESFNTGVDSGQGMTHGTGE